MTSSLVGSEMCIRDSSKRCLGTVVSKGLPPTMPRSSVGVFAGAVVEPVSYTHLTLPTICSV
eukprot:5125962-Prorocentrum_lima.AAC.1